MKASNRTALADVFLPFCTNVLRSTNTGRSLLTRHFYRALPLFIVGRADDVANNDYAAGELLFGLLTNTSVAKARAT